jgi:6-phosphogluconolactonase
MPDSTPVERVTLTGAALAGSRTMIIVIEGAKKREILERAISEGPLSGLGIGRILAEFEAPVDIYWTA